MSRDSINDEKIRKEITHDVKKERLVSIVI